MTPSWWCAATGSVGGMSGYLDISALGAVLRLPLSELVTAAEPPAAPDLAERVRTAWHDAAAPAGSEADRDAGAPAGIVFPATAHADRFMESLSSEITQAALLLRAGQLAMLHAGGIALADGRVICFVAASGHGKTTLTRMLSELHGYVSDETIAFDEQLRVYPYRKPLSVVTPGRSKQQLAPSGLGLRELPQAPLRLAALVLLDRQGAAAAPRAEAAAGPSAPTLRPVSLREALGELLAQSSYSAQLPGPLQRFAQAISEVGGVWSLSYREAADVREAFPRLAAELLAPGTAEAWHPVPDHLVERSGAGDAIVLASGEALVFAAQHLHALSDVAAEVWQGALAGDAAEQLAARVVARFGTPPAETGIDPAHYVATTIAELREAGVLPTSPA
ncbi:energy-coupling factor transporter ATP-binding protein EcfA2 [Leucobacter exalbidus]|uniref:Energy-coupling factor transporter ATP-binding protein EcfA2 n=1 Tax=Leucobacter exalbidus TaxID=662960 RepID=A0A940T3X1_9MICO|nr:PqqD family protein [Leucobacter exalbidus]MBP1326238.1 energy-coupling factor transporter ATP-binding protein EcfA2 [Leucobacter exalbidus]